tara:strand:- start:369 stop:773 length:405 start_codon:yes stop_codon:yes gene_type:complete
MATLRQKRARIYKDFDLSFSKNSITGDINKKLDVNAVKQSMKNLILSGTFERPFQPDLGTELGNLLFENATMFTADRIKNTIENVLENYEKRAEVFDIECNPQYDNNAYDVTIRFQVVGINQPEELQVKLERLR